MDHIKSVIGQLLAYYRRVNNISVEQMVLNNDLCHDCKSCSYQEKICSCKTYYRIEKGYVVNDECIYRLLALNINKKYNNNDRFYENLDELNSHFYISLIKMDTKELLNIKNNIMPLVCEYKEDIYINEILNLYLNIINLEINDEVNVNCLDMYISLYDHVTKSINDLIIYYLYKASKRVEGIRYLLYEIINRDDLDGDIFITIKLDKIRELPYFDAYNEMKTMLKSVKNKHHEYLIYNAIAYIQLNNHFYKECYQTLDKCKSIISNSCFEDVYSFSLNRQFATAAYLIAKYDDVIKLLLNISDNCKKYIGIQVVLLFNSLEQVNRNNEVLPLLNNININELNDDIKKIIIYYKNKYQNPLDKKMIILLEDYICKELLSVIVNYGTMFIEIFKKELIDLITCTKNYKCLYNFEKYILENEVD